MLRSSAILVVCVLIAGCEYPAIISDLEEDKVIVQKHLFTSITDVIEAAKEGCALHDRVAVPVSKRSSGQPGGFEYHLFACINK